MPSLGSSSLESARIYAAGIQLGLPFRNRVAQSDAARDTLQFRQMQARLEQLQNQVSEEIANAYAAVQVAHAAYNAAVQTRVYQEQLLEAEKERLSVGASTNFFVVQDVSYLSQARSSEVGARSAYIKSKLALERATGSILEDNSILLDDAIRGPSR